MLFGYGTEGLAQGEKACLPGDPRQLHRGDSFPGAACLVCVPVQQLGRGLISPYPESDRGKLDEGEVIGGELVITGGNTPALLDLVKEPLDEVT